MILGHSHQCGMGTNLKGMKPKKSLNWPTGGGLARLGPRPGPLVVGPIAPKGCMLALIGQLGLWVHWVWALEAHGCPSRVQWAAQGGPIATPDNNTATTDVTAAPHYLAQWRCPRYCIF